MSRKKAEDGKALSELEARFVAEYLIDLSQAGAMERADGAARRKNWKELGYQMMRRPHVKAAVDEQMKELMAKLDVTAQRVLFDIDRLASLAEAHKDFAAAIKARELLGKYLKMWTEKHEHGGIGGGPVQFTITEKEADL